MRRRLAHRANFGSQIEPMKWYPSLVRIAFVFPLGIVIAEPFMKSLIKVVHIGFAALAIKALEELFRNNLLEPHQAARGMAA